MKKKLSAVRRTATTPRKRNKAANAISKTRKAELIKRLEALLVERDSPDSSTPTGEVAVVENPGLTKSDVGVVIDGSNVVMKVGLDVLQAMLRVFTDPIVFFDANIEYLVAKRWPERLNEFKTLLNDNRGTILKVAAHSRADGYILQLADAEKMHIISLDLFLDWAEKYPFVKNDEQGGDKRIHGFRVVTVRGRRMLQIPDLGIYMEV